MADDQNIDPIITTWDFNPLSLNVRKIVGDDGRDVLQMRIDMGVMQMELDARPDRWKPEGFDTYLDLLRNKAEQLQTDLSDATAGKAEVINDKDCLEVDREFVQFYHRRICWLHLHNYSNAVRDADHTLALMDFCQKHSTDQQWTVSHEQYRPFVLFHRTQAAALAALQSDDGAEGSISAINIGLDKMKEIYTQHEIEEQFEEEELVKRLKEMREEMREKYEIGRTLQERLEDAVRDEQYELAAQLRDELAQRSHPDQL